MSDSAHESPTKHLPGEKPQFKVVSHSNLIYWWPVWSLGFVMVTISFASGTRLAIVPEGSMLKIVDRDKGSEVFELTAPRKSTQFLIHAAAVPSAKMPSPLTWRKTRPSI